MQCYQTDEHNKNFGNTFLPFPPDFCEGSELLLTPDSNDGPIIDNQTIITVR